MAGFDENTQKELQEFIQRETTKAELQNTVHEFTGRCWELCIKDAKTNQLNNKESACLQNCVNRFIDSSVHVVKRLQSLQ
ncbi:putative TIM8-translocase of the mitochondrial inner membrane [Coemansia reversa NRRL 1564]|uniref:Mitochondrial import inner membrane translocase subunit n=1 Tax=Coemansia reversa (strain ATCC 12441 / NRRL 1564) TaxID=763665 RepID=A0A2G5B276_COERN|nr:putative TIM8-translocase of the mitochondrial inner membrane [Coemansia reversa NRRL 1564]|eukprot:PIA13118.1 putative TIM8-translocase of the mitochondrial inner membrane [Coemansia reversa NRRL 1564]